MSADTAALREGVVAAARRLEARGLNCGSSGNVSVRVEGGFLITPSGVAPQAIAPTDLALLDAAGAVRSGPLAPSSETPLHAALYAARPRIGAVVHCHSPRATTLACTGRGISALHYAVVMTGGNEIPCARYATFGSDALAAAAIEALGEAGVACLLANHGQLAVGRDLAAALATAELVEHLADLECGALALGGGRPLEEAELERVRARLRAGYGRPRAR